MTTSNTRGLLPTLFVGVLLAAMDIAVLGPALPAIKTWFSVDDRTAAWAFNTFVFFNLVGVPIMTKLSDRHGRRLIYLIDIGLFGLGALTVALAPSFAVLLAGRAMQGLGAAGVFPVAAAVVGDAFPPERHGRALGILGAVFGVAFIVGPIMAGLLLLVDWRLIYVTFVPLAGVVMLLAWRNLPSGAERVRKPLDVAGLAMLGLILVSLAYGVNRIDASDIERSLLDPRVWSAFLVVLLGIPVFRWLESRAEDPVLRLGLFSNRQVVIACALAAAAGLSESAFIFLPALSIEAFGVSNSTASFMLMPLVSSIVIASPLAGRILDRVGSRAVVLGCQAILVAGIAVLAWRGDSLLFFYVGTIMLGVGLAGIMGPALSHILLEASFVSERGVSQGLITLFISIGQLIGGAAIGAVAASVPLAVTGYKAGFMAIALAATIAWLGALSLKRNGA